MTEDERCPYLKTIRAGDEAYHWCTLSDHPCMVEYNDEVCEEWGGEKREMADVP